MRGGIDAMIPKTTIIVDFPQKVQVVEKNRTFIITQGSVFECFVVDEIIEGRKIIFSDQSFVALVRSCFVTYVGLISHSSTYRESLGYKIQVHIQPGLC